MAGNKRISTVDPLRVLNHMCNATAGATIECVQEDVYIPDRQDNFSNGGLRRVPSLLPPPRIPPRLPIEDPTSQYDQEDECDKEESASPQIRDAGPAPGIFRMAQNPSAQPKRQIATVQGIQKVKPELPPSKPLRKPLFKEEDTDENLYDPVETHEVSQVVKVTRELVRMKDEGIEYAYWNTDHESPNQNLKQSKEALRVHEHAYTYMLTYMLEEACDAIQDSLLKCQPSSSVRGYFRVDIYNVVQSTADHCMDEFNALYGSIIDDLVLISLHHYIQDKTMEIIHTLPKHFKCFIVQIDNNEEIVCLSNIRNEIDSWLSSALDNDQIIGGKSLYNKPRIGTQDGVNNVTRVQSLIPPVMSTSVDAAVSRPDDVAHGRGFLINQKYHLYLQVNSIEQMRTDVIVKPANRELGNIDGASAKIGEAGGDTLELAIQKYTDGSKRFAAAKTVMTLPGRLRCEHVMHVVLPQAPGELTSQKIKKKSVKQLYQAQVNVLKKLDKTSIKSATMPIICEEMQGLSPEECTRCMVAALIAYKPKKRCKNMYPLVLHIIDTKEDNLKLIARRLDRAIRRTKGKKSSVQKLELTVSP